ncbi:hypothetical protein V1477_005260 [Vespula maculifrons]|uniref:Uncharacterized protein n=1 Tax=Vespula maculifrons TaxID=7453 RepID=A0ABD2CQB1_VESMC
MSKAQKYQLRMTKEYLFVYGFIYQSFYLTQVALLVINENASLPPKESIGNDKGRSTSKCKAITPTDRETIQLQKPSQSSYSEPELLYLTSDTVIWPRLCSPVEMLSA